MSRHLRLICKRTLRAADIEGDTVIYGRMTPDMLRFNPFWHQSEADPVDCAIGWIKNAYVTARQGHE